MAQFLNIYRSRGGLVVVGVSDFQLPGFSPYSGKWLRMIVHITHVKLVDATVTAPGHTSWQLFFDILVHVVVGLFWSDLSDLGFGRIMGFGDIHAGLRAETPVDGLPRAML